MDTKNVIGGMLAGAVIGVIVGLLLAPERGGETRKNILKGSRKLADDLKGTFEDSIESMKGKFNGGVKEVTKRGGETSKV